MVRIPPHRGYFEGVLQLRDCPKSIATWVRNRTEADNKSAIVKVKHFSFGTDLYFSDKNYLFTLGKSLRKYHQGVLKFTTKLHTRIDSKPVHRITIMYRYFPYTRDQWISYLGERWKIMHIARDVGLKDATGKKIRVPIEKLIPR